MMPETLSPRRLGEIAVLLEQAGYAVEKGEVNTQTPFEQLHVSLAEDGSHVGWAMRLFYQEDVLIQAEPAGSPLAAELETSATLCFLLELRRALPQERLFDLYRLLNFWSALLPLGHLGIQEGEPSGIFFRYALPHDAGFKPLIAAEILEQAGFYLNRLLPLFDEWLIDPCPIEDVMQASESELAMEALSQLQSETGFS